MMNLLPKSTSDFAKSEYWNTFFKQRGEKSFEWYGEYPELCGFLHKYIKARDKILVVGCGNSNLSSDMYDVGYRDITNIDISSVVIRKMKKLNSDQRPELVFLEMDALNMDFESESFSVVFDKGTLDALTSGENKESKDRVKKLLDEVDRVLKIGGRFIFVSLLQQHILSIILEDFISRCWWVRICRCHEVEEKSLEEGSKRILPVFMVVCSKFKKLQNFEPVLEVSLLKNGTISRKKNIEEMKKSILEDQELALICNGLRSSTLNDSELSLDIFEPEKEDMPKYHITIVESRATRAKNMKYSAFIVPQGREVEWIFGMPEGRQELLASCKVDRLCVVALGRGHDFTTLDKIQEDLSNIVTSMAPSSYKQPIQFLSIGQDLGTRKQIAKGFSELSGDYLIEEAKGLEGKTFRRLYFLTKKDIIQSESAVKTIKTKKGSKLVVDHSYLCSEYLGWMALGIVASLGRNDSIKDAGIVGLGGGSLVSYLRVLLPKLKLTAVELDPQIVQVATEYFDLVINEKMSVHIGDGIDWIKKTLEEGIHYDALIFDVDCKDVTLGMSGPPPNFVEADFLNVVRQIINRKGIFILNLICRDVNMRNEVWNRLTNAFCKVASVKSKQDVNEVVFCWMEEVDPLTVLSNGIEELDRIVKKRKLSELEFLTLSNLKDMIKLV